MTTPIKYRISSTATKPVSDSVKGAPLTSLEIDGNFRSIKDSIELIQSAYLPTGYSAPVEYVAGVILSSATQTVAYQGEVYAPKAAELPFTTSGTFEVTKFVQIQGVASADLAASSGSSLIGYDGQTVQDVLDGAVSKADYTELRAYTGRATRIYITGLLVTAKPAGIVGVFQYDSTDTGSLDDGATVIVDALGRRWKRDIAGGSVLVSWFETGADDATTAIQKAIDFVIQKRDKFYVDLGGASYSIQGTLNVNLENNSLPLAFATLKIKNGEIFKITAGYVFSASSGYLNQGFSIDGVTFLCNAGIATDVFDCDRLIDVSVSNCTFKRFRRVAYSGAVYRPGQTYYFTQSFKMTDCYIWGTDSYTNPVIDFGATYDCRFTRVFMSFGPGMVFRNASHALSIKDCIFQKLTTAAIDFTVGNLQNVKISGNYFEDNFKNISFSGIVEARALKISSNVFTGSGAGKSIYLIDWDKISWTSKNIVTDSNSATTYGFAIHGPIVYESSFTVPIRSVNDYQREDVENGGVAWRNSPAIVYIRGNEARASGQFAYKAIHYSGLAFQGKCAEATSGRSFVDLNGKSTTGVDMNFRIGAFGNADIYSIAGTVHPIHVNGKVAFGNTGDLYPVASSDTRLGLGANRWLEVRGDSIFTGVSGVKWTAGTGSPEGVVSGLVGSLYSRTDGSAGTSLYVKETGTGNTGWVAK